MRTNNYLNLNLIQESDALGVAAQSRQADLRQDRSAVSTPRSAHSSQIIPQVWRREFVYAVGAAMMIFITVGYWLV